MKFPTFLICLCLAGGLAWAQDKKPDIPEHLKERKVTTQHRATVAGKDLAYTVTTGMMPLKSDDMDQTAAVFYIAYTLDGVENRSQRPVTFSFNGGPGSSSVWLHLGLLGPKRVLMDKEGLPLGPPPRLVNNEYAMLDKTDLVFIDPVSTGFSRPVDAKKADDQFHGFQGDIQSVGEFVYRYASRENRWGSPKFLIGESYGTVRAAALVNYLQRRHGMYFNGVMLVSAVLSYIANDFDTLNDLPTIVHLPTYAATAWYHGQLDKTRFPDLDSVLKAAESFALNDYALALLKGRDLPSEERARVVAELSQLTGLSEAYLEQTNLRITEGRFTKELLRGQEQTVGRLDSRFKTWDRDAAGEYREYDPSMAAIRGPYTATLNHYVRSELGFETDMVYEILTGKVWPWNYKPFQNRYLEVSEDLRTAMTQNRKLKIYVGSGYYDLATPYYATDYVLDHMQLPAELEDNIRVHYYPAGHMYYIQESSLAKTKRDLDAFYDWALND